MKWNTLKTWEKWDIFRGNDASFSAIRDFQWMPNACGKDTCRVSMRHLNISPISLVKCHTLKHSDVVTLVIKCWYLCVSGKALKIAFSFRISFFLVFHDFYWDCRGCNVFEACFCIKVIKWMIFGCLWLKFNNEIPDFKTSTVISIINTVIKMK